MITFLLYVGIPVVITIWVGKVGRMWPWRDDGTLYFGSHNK